ncbi:MAG: hypothetical protein K6A32_05795 [Bacteroidales bacterium]|nr:hypothetical protein [Bacteroidales bacterium]
MTNEALWENNYRTIMNFMHKNARRPSKYAAEERWMLSWLKYNRKCYVRGLMSDERRERFELLEKTAKRLQRVNQFVYVVEREGLKKHPENTKNEQQQIYLDI